MLLQSFYGTDSCLVIGGLDGIEGQIAVQRRTDGIIGGTGREVIRYD